jgi:tetratricopeptide (TPR) repeat protein
VRCHITRSIPPELQEALAERELAFEDQEAFERAVEQARLEVGYAATPEANFHYGQLLAARGQFDEALPYLNKAVEQRAGYAAALAERGLVQGLLERYDRAMVDLMTAINAEPGYYRSWSNRAVLHAQRQMWSDVVRDTTRAIRLNPRYPLAYKLRAIAHKVGRRPAEALADFRAYLDLAPGATDREQIERTIAALDGRPRDAGPRGWLSKLLGRR